MVFQTESRNLVRYRLDFEVCGYFCQHKRGGSAMLLLYNTRIKNIVLRALQTEPWMRKEDADYRMAKHAVAFLRHGKVRTGLLGRHQCSAYEAIGIYSRVYASDHPS